jgi:hypothetical protein
MYNYINNLSMKRSTKHNSGTQTMVGIPIRTDKQRELIKKFDIKILEEAKYPHRTAKILSMIAADIGEKYDWEEDR